MPDHATQLRQLIRQSSAFMAMLHAARQVAAPDWYIGAGALRALVWDHLHGISTRLPPGDIDLIYFDASDLSAVTEARYAEQLRHTVPRLPWEVTNQARVHLWYQQHFGFAVPALTSISEAVATWPEYATCVAVQLQADATLDIVAPHGLDDLFGMVVRHNPTRASAAEYQRRVASKRYQERWPRVTILASQG
ncbi:nucleotidyltransferase family protein [Silvimonas sp. JCM 19000]